MNDKNLDGASAAAPRRLAVNLMPTARWRTLWTTRIARRLPKLAILVGSGALVQQFVGYRYHSQPFRPELAVVTPLLFFIPCLILGLLADLASFIAGKLAARRRVLR